MTSKYIISEKTDPYYNLALEELLSGYCSDDTAVLYLWQNDNTIVVGKNQDVMTECRAERFMAEGGRIARRRSGGGAVYHDMGNQNLSFICKRGAVSEREYTGIITAALSSIGIAAAFNGKNDIIAGGQKVSGSAFYNDGHIFCGHSTILVSSDIGRMTEYLTPDSDKMRRNGVRSVRSRVADLSELLSGITVDMVRKALIEAVSATPLEAHIPEEIIWNTAEKYADPEFIYGGVL